MRRKFQGEIVGLGRITMIQPSIGTMKDALRIHHEAESETKESQFTDAVLAGMIVDPPMTADQIAGLPDSVVSGLIDLAANDVLKLRQELDELPDGLSAPEKFAAAYRKHSEEFFRGISQMLADTPTQLAQGLGETLAKSINDHLVDATAFRVKLDFPDIVSGFASQVSPTADLSEVMKALGEASLEHRESMKRLSSLPTAFDQAVKALAQQSTLTWPERIRGLNSYNATEPFLSHNLIESGLDSSYIHSRTYEIPDLQLPQSPKEIPESTDYAHRERLSAAYDVLMRFELDLRDFIEAKLSGTGGPKWWRQRVPEAVWRACEDRKHNKEERSGPSHKPMSYAYIHDLRAIVVRGDNWREVFQACFRNQREIEVMFNWVGGVRDPVAHSRPIEDMEYQQFIMAVNVIRRGMDQGLE